MVLGGYLAGYALFVGVFAPRLILTSRARARLEGAPTRAAHAPTRPAGWTPGLAELAAAVGVYPVHTSETLLAFVQFGLLALFLYYVGAGRVAQAHPRVQAHLHPRGAAPTFGGPAQVAANLVLDGGPQVEPTPIGVVGPLTVVAAAAAATAAAELVATPWGM